MFSFFTALKRRAGLRENIRGAQSRLPQRLRRFGNSWLEITYVL